MKAYELRVTLWVNGRLYGRAGTAEAWDRNRIRLYVGIPSVQGGLVHGEEYRTLEGELATPEATADGVAVYTNLPCGRLSAAVNTAGGGLNWRLHPLVVGIYLGQPEHAWRRILGDNTAGPWPLIFAGQIRRAIAGSIQVWYMSVTLLEEGYHYSSNGETISLNFENLPRDPRLGNVLTDKEWLMVRWTFWAGGE